MTEEYPRPGSHWGAPEPADNGDGPTAEPAHSDGPGSDPADGGYRHVAAKHAPPDGAHGDGPVEHRPAHRQSPQIPRRVLYGALGVAGVIVLVASGLLVTDAIDGPKRKFGQSGAFSVQSTTDPGPDRRKTINPHGAPYSYRMPAGFIQVPVPRSTGAGTAGLYETAVTPPTAKGGDIIAVSVFTLGTNSNSLSYDRLQEEIDRLSTKVAQKPGAAKRVPVAGKRALKYVFDFGKTQVRNYFVFSGTIEVQVRCQWTDQRPVIELGCDDVVSSLRIT